MPAKTISRRRLLKTSFAFSAAALLGGRGIRLVSAGETAGDDHHLIMIGDWGAVAKEMKAQAAVAEGIKGYVARMKLAPDAMLLLGDNFYGPFKGGTKCPRWNEQFEAMYPTSMCKGPCYALLGNHDYDDEPVSKLAAELAYANDTPGTRWTMPAKWYAFEFPRQNPLVKFIALDSNYENRTVSLTAEERTRQSEWFKNEIAKPRTAPYLIVMAHHPIYSNGVHGDTKALIKEWAPLLKEQKAHFYFCGHDHDMQHMEFEDHPTSFILSGGGGARIRAIDHIKHGPFGKGIYGFSHLQINADRILVRHLDANQKQLHAMSKTVEGKVSVIA